MPQLVRVKGRDEFGRRIRWIEADALVQDVAQVLPGAIKGDKGEPGRCVQVFETSTEPAEAVTGDFWVTGE